MTVPAPFRHCLLIIIVFFSWGTNAQKLLTEKKFGKVDFLLPYDLPYTYPVGNNAFVMLRETGMGEMLLTLFDDGLEELWQTTIGVDTTESVPRMFVKGDTVVLYSFTVDDKESKARLSFRYYSLLAGISWGSDEYLFSFNSGAGYRPAVSFSRNHSKFIVYGYIPEGEGEVIFNIFGLGSRDIIQRRHLQPESFPKGNSNGIYLDDDGSLFVVVSDILHEELMAFYSVGRHKEWTRIKSGIFAGELLEWVGNISIIRQGASTFFVAVPAMIEYDLTGIFTLGINVVFKNILYAHQYDLLADDITKMYEKAYDLRDEANDDDPEAPSVLQNFNLVKTITDDEKGVVLIFEHAEGAFNRANEDMPWQIGMGKDDHHIAGDLLLLGFSPGGELKWRSVIRKAQDERLTGIGGSFLSMKKEHNLRIAFQSRSREYKMHVTDMDIDDGSLTSEALFLPDRPFNFVKKFSCWFDEKSMLLGGITPADPPEQVIMLVEF